MKEVRYRTESFSGIGVRDAASVMAYETFELGNTDILYTLTDTILYHQGELTNRCFDYIDHLNNSGYVEGVSFEVGGVSFFKEVLAKIKELTGVELKYALWLADKETVIGTESGCYGRDMCDADDYDAYEIGPVVLSELGFDGTLYGYEEYPLTLIEQLENLKDAMTNIINERENDNISVKRAEFLDEKYLEVDTQINEIKEILAK